MNAVHTTYAKFPDCELDQSFPQIRRELRRILRKTGGRLTASGRFNSGPQVAGPAAGNRPGFHGAGVPGPD
jgi:hypothetical protein